MRAVVFLYFAYIRTISCNVKPAYNNINNNKIQDKILTNFTGYVANPKQTIITFINGIYHSHEDCMKIVSTLEDLFDEEVRLFYNPSTGNWLSDASQAGFALVTKPNDHILAQQLANHLRIALKDVGINGRILHIAHSGGAIITYLAAKHHLTVNETSRIDVITFGGGRSITHKYFKGRITNYYSKNDPLVLLDQRAFNLIKRVYNTSSNEVRDKHNTSFIFLTSLARNPILDHSMEGPSYLAALQLESIHFRRKVRALPAKLRFLTRIMRKRAARVTGVRHFWDRLHFVDPPELPRLYFPNFTSYLSGDFLHGLQQANLQLLGVNNTFFFNFNLTHLLLNIYPNVSYINSQIHSLFSIRGEVISKPVDGSSVLNIHNENGTDVAGDPDSSSYLYH